MEESEKIIRLAGNEFKIFTIEKLNQDLSTSDICDLCHFNSAYYHIMNLITETTAVDTCAGDSDHHLYGKIQKELSKHNILIKNCASEYIFRRKINNNERKTLKQFKHGRN